MFKDLFCGTHFYKVDPYLLKESWPFKAHHQVEMKGSKHETMEAFQVQAITQDIL